MTQEPIYPVKQYIGARYVPIFGRKNENTIEWDNSKPYEPLSVVTYQGNSYTSKQYVPSNIEITDETYWALTGNYNAQIEQYRQETARKLNTVAHDDSLTGEGTTNNPLKLSDNIKNTLQQVPNIQQEVTTNNTRMKRNYVLLGDSWTVVHDYALYKQLKQLNPNSKWYDYGVGGSVVQQLPQQIAKAQQDTTLHVEEITDVIIVMGTNNVFWKNLNGYSDITATDAFTAFKSVKDYFPTANIHYFPNNSKTLNEGRNRLYRNIINGAIKANIQVHPESLYWLAGKLSAYNGDDQEGVQHLSDNGYISFANFINNIVHGGSPFYLSQWIGNTESHDYHNPSSADDINSDTLKIVNINGAEITTIGYLTNVILSFTYFADEKIDIVLWANVKITSPVTTGKNYITCDNWNAKIAPHTLPYIFLGTYYKTYEQPSYITNLSNNFSSGFTSLDSNKSTLKNIYISIPYITSNVNTFHMTFNALTSITNFGI